MLNSLPSYIAILFGITTLLVAGILFLAIKNARTDTTKKKATVILFGMLVWLALQGFLALNGFYKDINTTPPKMLLISPSSAGNYCDSISHLIRTKIYR